MSGLDADQTPFAGNRAEEQRLARTERLDLEPLFKLALDPRYLEEGEIRLVGRIDEVLPGQTISPSASQVRGAALVVAHLEYARPAVPRPDFNTRLDVKTDDDANADREFEASEPTID
jgi:hypothetical protein